MNRYDFCNAIDNYIINDQMQSAIKLVEKATLLDTTIVMNIFTMIEHDLNTNVIGLPNMPYSKQPFYRSPAQKCSIKQATRTIGHLVWTELQNLHNRYTFVGSTIMYNIKKFNFTRHFEFI